MSAMNAREALAAWLLMARKALHPRGATEAAVARVIGVRPQQINGARTEGVRPFSEGRLIDWIKRWNQNAHAIFPRYRVVVDSKGVTVEVDQSLPLPLAPYWQREAPTPAPLTEAPVLPLDTRVDIGQGFTEQDGTPSFCRIAGPQGEVSISWWCTDELLLELMRRRAEQKQINLATWAQKGEEA